MSQVGAQVQGGRRAGREQGRGAERRSGDEGREGCQGVAFSRLRSGRGCADNARVISRTAGYLVILAVLAVAACDPGDPMPRAAASTVRPGAGTAGVVRGTGAGTHRRGRLIAGERVMRVPAWPPVGAIDAGLRERMPAELRAAVDRSPVPVLVPGDATWLARTHMHSPEGPDSFGYALSVALSEGSTVSVQASRIATLLPHVGHVRGNRRIRGGDGWFSDNDGIRTASWIEHGVAYTLDLECAAPDGPACAPEVLERLVRELVYVGGAGSVGGAQ